MNNLQQMINETKERRAQDKIKYDEHDDDLCMLCNAYGEDKRSLFIACLYDIKEVVPEAIDIFDVPHLKDRGYYLRICKNCRGELLSKLSDWRNEMIARREIPKDHDGHNEYDEPNCNIPVRINGRIVMMSEPQFHAYKERQAKKSK